MFKERVQELESLKLLKSTINKQMKRHKAKLLEENIKQFKES